MKEEERMKKDVEVVSPYIPPASDFACGINCHYARAKHAKFEKQKVAC